MTCTCLASRWNLWCVKSSFYFIICSIKVWVSGINNKREASGFSEVNHCNIIIITTVDAH